MIDVYRMHDGILEYIFKTDRDIHNFEYWIKINYTFRKELEKQYLYRNR